MPNEDTTKSARPQICLILVFVLVIGVVGYEGLRGPGFYMQADDEAIDVLWRDNEPVEHEGRILLVHSYHAGYPWVDAITRGARMALSGRNIEMQTFYMDTKRNTDELFKQKIGQTALDVIEQWAPDVVIAADDNAQVYVAREYATLRGGEVVFCGVNAEPDEYGYPAENVTGVLERPHFRASIDLVRELVPEVQRIALVSDNSPTSAGALRHMQRQDVDAQIVLVRTPDTFEQWQSAIRECQESADAIAIYTYHTVKQAGSSVSMEPAQVMSWTVENTSIPIIGFLNFAVADGALCGHAESGFEHGLKAARMAIKIIDDTPPQRLEMITALEGHSMLNMQTARKLGINVPDAIKSDIGILVGD